MVDNSLYAYMEELLEVTPRQFVRYKYNEIDWTMSLLCIVGPRGVGKSTMLLQHILNLRDSGVKKENYLYVSADHIFFSTHSLSELADEFVKEGGTNLYIDEVHKYKGWSKEIKSIYDIHKKLNIVLSGSSVLDIEQGAADLSRRIVMYEMQGLSFREYLELFKGIKVPIHSIQQILANNISIPGIEHPLPLFREYLAHGYYPFAVEGAFPVRMEQVIAQTVEVDIPQYADMKVSTARKLKKLLMIISKLAPFKPNFESLAREIGVSKNNVPDYLLYLAMAQLISQLRDDTGGLKGLGKVEKVYIDNPSLMTVLASGNPDIGNMRETFFYNQTRVRNETISSRESDFRIGEYTFEIGGRKKGKKQIENVENGFIVKDDIEFGHGIVIPLWAFGLKILIL
jgi:predicted AAA+ superfamily ATPase